MARGYTEKEIREHLNLVYRDVAAPVGGWNARYQKLFNNAAKALESLGNTPLSGSHVREVFKTIYIKPPRKRR